MSEAAPGPAIAALESLYRWDQDAVLATTPVPVSVLAARAADESRTRYGRRVHIEQVMLGGHFFLRQEPVGTAAAIRNRIAPT
jgi:hypothetical protein